MERYGQYMPTDVSLSENFVRPYELEAYMKGFGLMPFREGNIWDQCRALRLELALRKPAKEDASKRLQD